MQELHVHVYIRILLHSHLVAYSSHHSPKSEKGRGGTKSEKERERETIAYDET